MFYIIAKYAHGKFMKIQKGKTKKTCCLSIVHIIHTTLLDVANEK
jgi:hypothetical protein